MEFQKFAEWLRIEVAATLYHLFLAEDNSPELFSQAKRIHSMLPYTALKQVIRFANPGLVMNGVLDLFLAQPFGSKSLAQRVLGLALHDGVKQFQKAMDALTPKIDDPILCQKLRSFCSSPESIKNAIRQDAQADQIDIVVAILRSEEISPPLKAPQIGKVFNAYVAWNNAVENVCRDPPSTSNISNPSLGGCGDEARCSIVRFTQAISEALYPSTGQGYDAECDRRGKLQLHEEKYRLMNTRL